MRKTITTSLEIFAFTLFYYIPLLANPMLFLARDNDLQEFFWPIYYFVKNQIVNHTQFPLWYPHILSGTPLLPDPQAPLFYPFNLLFLVLPIDIGFIVSFILHSFIGGIAAYLFAKKALKLTQFASLVGSFLYISTPKLAAYIEAGHVGLIHSFAWIPFVFLSIYFMYSHNSRKAISLFASSLALLFLCHTFAFIITLFLAGTYFLTLLIKHQKKRSIHQVVFFIAGVLLAIGIVSIALIPQIIWSGQTNRVFLTTSPDVYPKWQTKKEFLFSIIFPYLYKDVNGFRLNTEQWIPFGVLQTIFVGIAFIRFKKHTKLFFLLFSIVMTLIALNNISPIYSWLITQTWYQILRVSTRVWIGMIFTVLVLSVQLLDTFRPRIKLLLSIALIAESLLLSWMYLAKQPYVAPYVYDTTLQQIKKDPGQFRVFCLDRCIAQKQAVIHNLELVDGYSTLIQQNYNRQFWGFITDYWQYYTLSLPPMGIYTTGQIEIDPISLGDYNTKYILSPYPLSHRQLILHFFDGRYYVYENKLFQSRSYYITSSGEQVSGSRVMYYSPNTIIIDVSNHPSDTLILSEVYSPGWVAFDNERRQLEIKQTSNALRSVELLPDTKTVTFSYQPESLTYGKALTIFAITGMVSLVLLSHKKAK